MDESIELGERLLTEHYGSRSLEEVEGDSVEISDFGRDTLHSVPLDINIGKVVYTFFSKNGLRLKPSFIYRKGKNVYRLVDKTGSKNTSNILRLYKAKKIEEAEKELANPLKKIIWTKELEENVSKNKSHHKYKVAKVLDLANPQALRQLEPRVCEETYYPFKFLTIKAKEDEYRSNPQAYDYYYGLKEVDFDYIYKRSRKEEEIYPNTLINPNVKTYIQTKRDYNDFIDKIISEVTKMFPTIPLDQLVIAGGAISSLFHDRFKVISQDIDVFVIGDIDKEELYESLVNKNIVYNKNIIATIRNREDRYKYKVQLIKRKYNSISEILHGFDVDSSCIGLECHTKSVFVSKRFDYAFKRNMITIDLDRLSPSYEARIFKYARRGWKFFIPGVNTFNKFNLKDDRELKFIQEVLYMRDMLRKLGTKNVKSITSYWGAMSGMTRLALVLAFSKVKKFNQAHFNFVSDYLTTTMYNIKYEENIEVFDEWLTENPGTQHTSSFQPLPNDKSWYRSSFEDITELINITNEITNFVSKKYTGRIDRLYKTEEENTYIGGRISSSFTGLKPTKYYYMSDPMLSDEQNNICVMTVYDSETKKIVGTLSGSHYGEILPYFFTNEDDQTFNNFRGLEKGVVQTKIPVEQLIDYASMCTDPRIDTYKDKLIDFLLEMIDE